MEDQGLTSVIDNNKIILLLVKISVMSLLGIGSLCLGMLPLTVDYCRKKRQRKCASSTTPTTSDRSVSLDTSAQAVNQSELHQGLLTSLLLCFGGGVLLFTTFLHLIPEVRDNVDRHQKTGQLYTIGQLSVTELLVCIGFFLVYLVEEAVHATLTDKPGTSKELLHRTVSVRRCCNKQISPSSVSVMTISTTAINKSSTTIWQGDTCGIENGDKFGVHNCRQESPDISTYERTLASCSSTGPEPRQVRTQIQMCPGHSHNTSRMKDYAETSVRGLLTVVALSFHAIFEGLAVGLEPVIASVIYLAIAIATHKFVIAFCVGMELYVAGASKKSVIGYLSILSVMTPIGIIIGLALSYLKNDNANLGPIPTILQGMAAGTLLYVVFFEVLSRERANEKSGLLQLLAIFVGFIIMLALQLATSHAHSHSHGGGHGHSHSPEDEEHHHELSDNKHAYAITGAIEDLASTVAEHVTSAITTSTTKSFKQN